MASGEVLLLLVRVCETVSGVVGVQSGHKHPCVLCESSVLEDFLSMTCKVERTFVFNGFSVF